jgi:hypothetical protein
MEVVEHVRDVGRWCGLAACLPPRRSTAP